MKPGSQKIIIIILTLTGLFSCKKVNNSPVANNKVDTVFFIGDSIDAGYGLADNTLRHTTLFCAQINATEANYAILGLTMQDGTPTGYGGSILTQLNLIPNFSGKNNYLYIMLGTNDVEINSGVYTAALFKSSYQVVLNNAASKGWPLKRIMLVSPPYIGNYSFSTFLSSPARLQEYGDTVQSVAKINGTQFLDMYMITNDNGAASLLDADGLHYNVLGNQVMANAETANFMQWKF